MIGVSTDPVKRHAKFAEKYGLPFTLLADEEKDVVKRFGVWGPKRFMGKEFLGTKRQSVLIDPEGVVAKVYEQVKPAEHPAQVLGDLAELKRRG